MSEFVERAAQAARDAFATEIKKEYPDFNGETAFRLPWNKLSEVDKRAWRLAVHAILMELRQPTEAMVVAGRASAVPLYENEAAVQECWRAMIDGALK